MNVLFNAMYSFVIFFILHPVDALKQRQSRVPCWFTLLITFSPSASPEVSPA
jgi:hypothetical protein